MKAFLTISVAVLGLMALTGVASAMQDAPKKMSAQDVEKAMPKDGDDVAVMETSMGRIVLMFFPDNAPKHVANFKGLVKDKFYDGVRFHRCIKNFMIQGGDPNSKELAKAGLWGTGGHMVDGKEVTIPAEFESGIPHVRGVLSMARSQDPNSASSQFFIMHDNAPFLDGKYSSFGKVVSGMDVVDQIVMTGDPNDNGHVEPEKAVVIKSVKLEKWPLKGDKS